MLPPKRVASRARIFWLHQTPLQAGSRVLVRVNTGETTGVVRSITHAVDPGQMAMLTSERIAQNQVGEIEISLARSLAADPCSENPVTGRVVLEFGGRIAGGGLVLDLDTNAGAIDARSRSRTGTDPRSPALVGRSHL
jgi:bifunctional enzyme CysN/CysC